MADPIMGWLITATDRDAVRGNRESHTITFGMRALLSSSPLYLTRRRPHCGQNSCRHLDEVRSGAWKHGHLVKVPQRAYTFTNKGSAESWLSFPEVRKFRQPDRASG